MAAVAALDELSAARAALDGALAEVRAATRRLAAARDRLARHRSTLAANPQVAAIGRLGSLLARQAEPDVEAQLARAVESERGRILLHLDQAREAAQRADRAAQLEIRDAEAGAGLTTWRAWP